MPDLNSLSNEELMQIAGSPSSGTDLNLLSNEQLMQIAGPPTPTFKSETRGVGNRFLSGAADLAGFFSDIGRPGAEAIMTGISSLFGAPNPPFPESASQAIKDEMIKKGILTSAEPQTELGKIAGKVAYFAPSVAVPGGPIAGRIASAGAAGIASGITEVAGGSEQAQGIAGLLGSLTPVGAKAIVSYLAPNLETAGKALLRKSIGARQTDFTKSARNLEVWDLTDYGVETATKKAIDHLQETGALGSSTNAQKLANTAMLAESELQKKAGELINTYDAAGRAPVFPQLNRATKYILSGKVNAPDVPAYVDKIDEIEQAIANEGKGSLRYIQNQKIYWGGLWEKGNEGVNGFYQAVYKDLKDAIEKAVPEIKPINQELSKFKLVIPVLKRNLGASEAKTGIAWLMQALRTSGGVLTTPTLIGSAIGGVSGGVPGLIAGATLGAAASPAGEKFIGRALINTAKSGSVPSAVTGSASAIADLFNKPQTQPPTENQPTKEPEQTMTKESDQQALNEIKANPYYAALAQTESSFDPKAKNPKSSATGLFQLTSATAKSLGVDDPTDITQSWNAVQRLTDQHRSEFGDNPEILYAAHFLGATLLRKVLRGESLSSKEQSILESFNNQAMPNFRQNYNNVLMA